jgi:predicted outer membrane lipoprotein
MDYHVSAWLVGALLALASGLAAALYAAIREAVAPLRSRRPR